MNRLKKILSFLLLVTILTAIVDMVMFLSDYIPILNRMETSLFDWDIQDIVYSSDRFKETKQKDDRITLINFEHTDRDTIALLIEKIAANKPGVVGVHAVFDERKDSIKDEKLRKALGEVNVVMAMDLLQWDEKMERYVNSRASDEFFETKESSYGFTNLVTYDPMRAIYRLQDDGVMRAFSPFENLKGDTVYCFPLELVKRYDKSIFESYEDKFDLTSNERLKYYGDSSFFNILSYKDIILERYHPSEIEGRIVMLTYLGYKGDDTRNSEDKHFTPLNSRIIARNKPDTFGGVIHANIALSVLNGVRVKNATWLITVLVNIAFVVLFVLTLETIRMRWKEKFSLYGRVTAYSFIVILIGLSLLLYFRMDFRIDLRMAIVYIIALPEIYVLYTEKFLPFLKRMIIRFNEGKTIQPSNEN